MIMEKGKKLLDVIFFEDNMEKRLKETIKLMLQLDDDMNYSLPDCERNKYEKILKKAKTDEEILKIIEKIIETKCESCCLYY